MKKLLLVSVNVIVNVIFSVSVSAQQLTSWMSKLPDNRMVCKVSIPGTHDASTAEGFLDKSHTNDYTTQVAKLKTQLNGGIRYFDLRLIFNTCAKGDTILQMSHRTASVRKTYTEVLSEIASFLQKYPSEFIIIKIQYDGGTLSPQEQQTWNRLIRESITHHSSLITHRFRKDLTVGEARGKILLLSRTPYGEPISGALTNWDDEGTADYTSADLQQECNHWLRSDTDSAHLYVQDFYNTIGTRMPEKLAAIELMYHKSQQIAPDDPVWILSHTSGFSTPKMNAIGYAENASKANKTLIQLLSRKEDTRPIGIIAMDYSCIDHLDKKIGTLGRIKRDVLSKTLTRKIITRNFVNP